MLRLKEKILAVLAQSANQKSATLTREAETKLILYHFFREQISKPELCLVTPEIEKQALAIVRQRGEGIPLQHLLGYQFFYEHEYFVNEFVLIPRPETEILVQAAIDWMKRNPAMRFAELGLGSGIISCELLFASPKLQGVASEISERAIEVAKINLAAILGPAWCTRLEMIDSKSLLEPHHVPFQEFLGREKFDLIISNPPYVSRNDEIETEVAAYEPHTALFSPKGDLYFYESFIKLAPQILSSTGAAFFEIPHERATDLEAIFATARLKPLLLPDLTGRSRVLKCTF